MFNNSGDKEAHRTDGPQDRDEGDLAEWLNRFGLEDDRPRPAVTGPAASEPVVVSEDLLDLDALIDNLTSQAEPRAPASGPTNGPDVTTPGPRRHADHNAAKPPRRSPAPETAERSQLDVSTTIPVDSLPAIPRPPVNAPPAPLPSEVTAPRPLAPRAPASPPVGDRTRRAGADEAHRPSPRRPAVGEEAIRLALAGLEDALHEAEACEDAELAQKIRSLHDDVGARLTRAAHRKRIDAALKAASELMAKAGETSFTERADDIRAKLFS